MNKPTKPTCSTCPYFVVGPSSLMAWEAGERFYIQGACRRRAPDAMAGFVQVSGQDWCGEHPQFPNYLEALKAPELNPTPTAIQLTKEDEGSWWLTRGGWKAKVQTVGRMVQVIHDIPYREDELAFHSLDGTHPCLLQYDLTERTNAR